MKKLISSIFTLITLSLLIASCTGDSYGKRLDKEKKAIKNYLSDNGIVTLRTYPKDHKFKENEFYLDASGVYMRVVDPGFGKDTLTPGVKVPVTLRFDSVYYISRGDSANVGNNFSGAERMSFTYGLSGTYRSENQSSLEYFYMSPACALPLTKGVRNGAIVDLIVPFVNGSALQLRRNEPQLLKRMHYSFYQ